MEPQEPQTETQHDPNAEAQQSPKAKIKKPVYKQWWFYVIIAVVVVAVIGAVAGKVGGNEGDTPETPSDPETPAEPAAVYYIGDRVSVGDLEYTLTQVVDSDVFVINGEMVTTENHFIKITLNLRNIGNSAKTLWSQNLTLYRGEAQYRAQYVPADFDLYRLDPGLQKEGTFIFEVPDKSTEYDYVLEVKNGKDTKRFVLKEREPDTETPEE